MEFVALFQSLLKRKWVLIIACFIAGITAFVSTMSLRKGYVSKAQLATEFILKDITKTTEPVTTAAQSDVQFSNLTEMLSSSHVFGITGYQLLNHDYRSQNSYKKLTKLSEDDMKLMDSVSKAEMSTVLNKKIETQTLLNPRIPSERKIFDILEIYGYDQGSLESMIKIGRVNVSEYVNVVAQTENPDLSAALVNGICANFLDYNRSLQTAQSSASLDTLRKQRQEKFAVYNQKQQRLTVFKTNQGVLNLESSGDSKVRQSSDFEAELATQQKTLIADQSEYAEVQSRLKSLKTKKYVTGDVLDLRSQINDLQQRYQTSKDPQLLKKINDLNKQRDDLINNSDLELTTNDRELFEKLRDRESELRAEISGLQKSIQIYQGKINSLSSNLSSYAGQEANIKALEQEVDLAKNEYTLADEKLNAAEGLNSAYLSGSIKQTLVGQPAMKPEGSFRKYIILAAVIATFFLCVIIIILLEYIDQSIRTPANFSKITNSKYLGSVPEIGWLRKSGSFLYSPELLNEYPTVKNLINNIRYEIESSGNKVFLITSTKTGEGKTTILSLLSSIYSNTNNDILLIDSNFSHNEITRKMNINTNDGNQFFLDENIPKKQLASAASNNISTSSTVSVAPTKYKNVDIIGCKEDYSLSSVSFPDHAPLNRFKQLSEKYDYVFIEGPSLNNFSDSKELSKYVDAVILVTSAKSSWKYQDKQSLSFLQNMDDRFLGSILNFVDSNDLK